MAHLVRIAAVGLEVCGELHHGLVVAALGGKEEPLGIEIVYDGDVVLPRSKPRKTRLVDTHGAHAGEGFLCSGLRDVDFDWPPQLLVRTAQLFSSLAHGKFAAHRQRQGLEGGRKARVGAGPRHPHLRGLAAANRFKA